MAIKGLKNEMRDFIKNLSSTHIKSGYEAIYTAFVEFLDSKDLYNNHDAHYIFKEKLNKNDIIDAGAHYINSSRKAYSKTAIEKYIRAITKFYNDYLIRFDNKLLELALPFSSLTECIEEFVDKALLDAQSVPPITNDEYECIKRYFKNKHKIYSQQKNEIMLRLLLLFGFKFSKLKTLKIEDFNLEDGLLNVDNALPEGEFVKLPKQLIALIESFLKNPQTQKSGLMFITKSGKTVSNSILSRTFNEIKCLQHRESLAFCPTGLAKYAIINQLQSGLSISYIRRITGMEKDVIDDCIKRFFKENNPYEDISICDVFIEQNKDGLL